MLGGGGASQFDSAGMSRAQPLSILDYGKGVALGSKHITRQVPAKLSNLNFKFG